MCKNHAGFQNSAKKLLLTCCTCCMCEMQETLLVVLFAIIHVYTILLIKELIQMLSTSLRDLMAQSSSVSAASYLPCLR